MVLAVIPTWAAPAAQAIRDAQHIAQALGGTDPGAHTVQAVAATIGWITGVQAAPLTGRLGGEVAWQVARAEMMLASAVAVGSNKLPDEFWAALDVVPALPLTMHTGWANGVCDTLGWLLQVTDRPPLRLPVRGPDGRPADAQTLYEAQMRRSHTRPEHEQRRAAWQRAQRDAALYARLAALAESVTS